MKNMKLKELTLCAMLTAIIFIQEELLTFIPNVQLTVLLIFCYATTLELYQTLIIITIHVFLDNLIMGSLNPITVIPMLIGWIIVVMIAFFSKKTNTYVKAVLSIPASILYTKCFAVANAWFLEVDIKAYLIADIPFDIVLCASSFISIVLLYDPITKFINKKLGKEEIKTTTKDPQVVESSNQ